MSASLKVLGFGLLLLLPLSTAHAQGPSLSPIANVSMNAGSTLIVNVIGSDVEDRPIMLTATLPPFGTLNTPTVGTGVVVTSVKLMPAAAHVGDYTAAVTATAGGVSTVRVFQITINAAGSNRAPVVVAPPLQEVVAGSTLAFEVGATDADGDVITSLTGSGVPSGATFKPNASNTAGTFAWTPGAGDAGDYDVQFTAANTLSGTSVTHVRVASLPALTITLIADVTVAGGATASVPVHAAGLPGAPITLTAALPTFATLDPPGSGTGAVNTTVTVAPPTGSAGTYHASITATSDGTSVTELFDIIVTGAGGGDNHAPVVTARASATVAIGDSLSFDVTATDPDGDHVNLVGSALPPGSRFIDHADNTGTFTWTPVSGQAGTYTASFTGRDNRGGSGSASTAITVTGPVPENHAPALSVPATKQVNEGVRVSFTVTAADQDNDHVALSAKGLPSGATFSDHGNNTGAFSWTPSSTQSGTYPVAFLGNDGHGGTGTATTTITVMNVVAQNHAPMLSVAPTKQVNEGVPLSFTVMAWDLDDDHVGLSANGLPSGATFSDRGNNTGAFSWTPSSTQSGTYRVAFLGNDGHGGTGSASTTLTVIDVVGGDGEDVEALACLIGKRIKPQKGSTCFRIRPVDDAFDVRDVVMSSIRLRFQNGSIAALGAAQFDLCCQKGDGHDSDDGEDDDSSDLIAYDGATSREIGGEHPANGRGNGPTCNLSCDDECHGKGHTPGHGRGHEKHGDTCDTLGVRACFSTDAMIRLLSTASTRAPHPPAWKHLTCVLRDAEILATLTSGATVVAKFTESSGGGGDEKNDRHAKGNGRHESLKPKVGPNPLNPITRLSFTMASEGKVRVTVYDMQGRLVKKLLDEFRTVGPQTLTWDGTNESNLRVVAGVYFLRIQAPDGSAARRVTVVKW